MQEIPYTATMYSKLSGCFMRYSFGRLEVYCQYERKWKESRIQDLKKAQVINI